MSDTKALVVLSGGMDSTICAAIAKEKCKEVHAITFNYNQLHQAEVQAATKVAKLLNLDSHEIVNLPPGILQGSCGLVNPDEDIPVYDSVSDLPEDEVAKTFLPMRNQLFITIAANRVFVNEWDHLYLGVSQVDYSGYPDCRDEFIQNVSESCLIGYHGLDILSTTRWNDFIKAPLIKISKAKSLEMAQFILDNRFDEVLGATHTCYLGVPGGCGRCAACLLRDRAFEEAKIIDPIWQFRPNPSERKKNLTNLAT